MTIVFRDLLGIVAVVVDSDGVDFCGSVAYFADTDGKDYQISVEHIIRIFAGDEGEYALD